MKYRCPRCRKTLERDPKLVHIFRAWCDKAQQYVKLVPVKTKPRKHKRGRLPRRAC